MVPVLLEHHKHEDALDVEAFAHSLPGKKAWEKAKQCRWAGFFKSHAFPHMKNFKCNQNAPEKKKCRTFSRYHNW